jgi:hypothetical protein
LAADDLAAKRVGHLAEIHRLKADDPRRKMNGGAGYGDERDDEDEKLIQFKRGGA